MINVTTETIVTAPTDTREAKAAHWATVRSFIDDGLPLPDGVRFYPRSIALDFTDLADARPWADAMGLTGRVRRDVLQQAVSHLSGEHQGAFIDMWVYEPAGLIGVLEEPATVETGRYANARLRRSFRAEPITQSTPGGNR